MSISPRGYVDPSDIGTVLSGSGKIVAATAGGGQQPASNLSADINRVETITTTGDSVTLPKAVPGASTVIFNKAINAIALSIYPATGDKINALAVNAVYSLPATFGVMFFCGKAGVWDTLLSA